MIALPVILFVISIIGIRFSRFHNDYLALSQTDSLKGLFAVMILMSHMLSYINFAPDATVDIYSSIVSCIGQLAAAMFFFCSGYGIVVSYQNKEDYYRTFLKNRFLRILAGFEISVLLFAIVNTVLGITYSQTQYITCWFAWGSIGNSSWFIFDILIFYIITFLAMVIKEGTGTGMKIFACVVSVLCVFFWAVMAILYGGFGDDGVHWYNTILCFSAGVWYAALKDRIDAFAKKWYFYWPALVLLSAAFLFLYMRRAYVEYYTILAPVFCLLFVWLTMKIKLGNPILRWLGRNAFSLYMVQQIPMIIIKHFGLNTNNYVYTALVVVSVLVCTWLFSMLLGLLDRAIFKKEKA